ncbi:MAG: hypothetical protein HY432_01415 [Candidatus Liptonbacteria bacterium]|nr:hypothetical protein [Candidatus Liptonbacteria bacterium]
MKKYTDKNSIDGDLLKKLYVRERKSSAQIAKLLGCSEHKVNYWLEKNVIPKRSISEAIYALNNPDGDPFSLSVPRNIEEAKLFGLGIGLYWGEGTRADKNTVKIGNSDPRLIKKFMEFMHKFYGIDKSMFKFHLHLFSDINFEEAMFFWSKNLGIKRSQFYKPTITKTGKLGTYCKKSKYGVLTLYFSNTKLRNIMVGLNEKP